MELDTLIKAIKVICETNDLKGVSHDAILDCAVRMHNTTKIQDGKSEDAATEKQKETLKKFSIEFKDDISKKDASKLISDKIDSFS